MVLKRAIPKSTVAICLIVGLSAILNLINLGIEGYANAYYAAGVKSMLLSLKNFWFVAYDPTGFVSIDKPPLGFWLQALSAKTFGFSGWSLILPQALAGTLSVYLLYRLVRQAFSTKTALLAALMLAVTPIFVAASRNNTIDGILVLDFVLATWAFFVAAKRRQFRYLLLSFGLIGLGFNIKMAEAYLILPAMYAGWALVTRLAIWRKILQLLAATALLVVISLAWALAVDSVPVSDRPYVGSTSGNREMELIFGHNGLDRLRFGNRGLPQERPAEPSNGSLETVATAGATIPAAANGYFGNNPDAANLPRGAISNPGILRFFAANGLSDQISWLVPLALIGFLASVLLERLRWRLETPRQTLLAFWFIWFLTEFVYFSVSQGITHTYYLTTMAPPLAALAATGLAALWHFYRQPSSWKSWLLVIGLVANVVVELLLLTYHPNDVAYWLVFGLTAALSTPAIIVLAIRQRRNPNMASHSTPRLVVAALAGALAGIGLPPLVWSATPLFFPMNGSSPTAGLELRNRLAGTDVNQTANTKLIDFLIDHNIDGERYLVATPSDPAFASDIIIQTGRPILPYGGFGGSDKVLTTEAFKQLVATGQLRFAFINRPRTAPAEAETRVRQNPDRPNGTRQNRGNRFGGRPNANVGIVEWITASGTLVPETTWRNVASGQPPTSEREAGGFPGGFGTMELYDLRK